MKVETGSLTNESDKKPNGLHEKTKLSSDPAQVPRSQSFFQVSCVILHFLICSFLNGLH